MGRRVVVVGLTFLASQWSYCVVIKLPSFIYLLWSLWTSGWQWNRLCDMIQRVGGGNVTDFVTWCEELAGAMWQTLWHDPKSWRGQCDRLCAMMWSTVGGGNVTDFVTWCEELAGAMWQTLWHDVKSWWGQCDRLCDMMWSTVGGGNVTDFVTWCEAQLVGAMWQTLWHDVKHSWWGQCDRLCDMMWSTVGGGNVTDFVTWCEAQLAGAMWQTLCHDVKSWWGQCDRLCAMMWRVGGGNVTDFVPWCEELVGAMWQTLCHDVKSWWGQCDRLCDMMWRVGGGNVTDFVPWCEELVGAMWQTLWHDVKHSWWGEESTAPCSWSNYSTNSNPQLDTKWRCCRVFVVACTEHTHAYSVECGQPSPESTGNPGQAGSDHSPSTAVSVVFLTSHTLQDRHFCFIRQLSISTDVWLQVRFHLYGYEDPDSNSDMAMDISVAMT